MRSVLGFLLLAAIAVGAAWYIGHLTGQIHLELGSLIVETSLPVAALTLIVLFLIVYTLFRLLATLFGLPGAFRRRGVHSRRRRGDRAVTHALVALAAQDAAAARAEAARAARYLGETPQTLLLQAYAGQIGGDAAAAETAFRKLAGTRDGRFLGLRGLLRQAIEREDFDGAAELAREAEAAHPGAAWIRAERSLLAVRTGDWRGALELAGDGAARPALAAAAAEHLEDAKEARKLARRAFEADPALPPAALAYARRLREAGRERSAQEVLRRAWAACPHPDLASFALAPVSPDKRARLKAGADLIRSAPDSPDSHLLLGRLSLDAGLFGEARRHAEAARAAGLNQRRLYTLLADIAEAEGDDPAHRAALHDALKHAAAAEPDPVWRCGHCGTVHAEWHPACPACHTAGQITWTVPPTALLPGPAKPRPLDHLTADPLLQG